MTIKIKEISIGGGGKISRNFQSVPYPCKVTVTGEDGDKPSEMIKKASNLLTEVIKVARELAEKELERLVREKEESEMAKFVTADNYINKKTAVDKALPVVREVNPTKKSAVKEMIETSTLEESVIMDPNEVTVMANTPKSLLVSKKGYQKWIAFSLMEGIYEGDYERGDYIEKITIKADKAKWFNEVKSWEKLKVIKN